MHTFPEGVAKTEKKYQYGSKEQARAVSVLLMKNDIAIAKNHGVFSVEKTVEEAAERILK